MARVAPYVSIGVRSVVNVEALNMVESVGNVTRHRTVPVIIQVGPGRYAIRWLPAVSGETLAHAYQASLVKLAQEADACRDRICYWCQHEEFVKHWDLRFWQQTVDKVPYPAWEKDLKNLIKGEYTREDIGKIESFIVVHCLVEDITGFLVTQGPVKRTSAISFSYMIPTYDAVSDGSVALDNQFFVRHAARAQQA